MASSGWHTWPEADRSLSRFLADASTSSKKGFRVLPEMRRRRLLRGPGFELAPNVFEKRYVGRPGIPPPEPFFGNEREVSGRSFQGDPHVLSSSVANRARSSTLAAFKLSFRFSPGPLCRWS